MKLFDVLARQRRFVYLVVSLKDPQHPLIRAFHIEEKSKAVTEEVLDIVD